MEIDPGSPKTGGVNWDKFGGSPGQAPKNLNEFTDDTIGWTKRGLLFVAAAVIVVVALLMVVGIRHRSHVAKEALAGLPWVFIGLMVAASSAAIVAALLAATM